MAMRSLPARNQLTMNTPEKIAARRASFAEIEAITSLAGFTPDAFTLRISEKLLCGDLTQKEALTLCKVHYSKIIPSKKRNPEKIAAHRESFRIVDGINALEGIYPDTFDLELQEKVILGEITTEEAIAILNDHYTRKEPPSET